MNWSRNGGATESLSCVVDGVGPSKAADPAQAQAENEFLAAAIAKEQTLYNGNAEGFMSFYADDTLSVQPEVPEMDKTLWPRPRFLISTTTKSLVN